MMAFEWTGQEADGARTHVRGINGQAQLTGHERHARAVRMVRIVAGSPRLPRPGGQGDSGRRREASPSNPRRAQLSLCIRGGNRRHRRQHEGTTGISSLSEGSR